MIRHPTGVSMKKKRDNIKSIFFSNRHVRSDNRKAVRALALVILMLASTQLILFSFNNETKELTEKNTNYVLDNSGVVTIDLGMDHACVIGSLNQMKCWGEGSNGKTGHENTASYGDDEKEMGQYLMFTDLGDVTINDVGSGEMHSCALLDDGGVKCWGQNNRLGSASGGDGTGARGDGYLEMGTNIPIVYGFGPNSDNTNWNATSISVGSAHSCSIVNNNSNDQLMCWGENQFGQLGMGSTETIGDTAGENMSVDLPQRGGIGIAQVSAGYSHTCILWNDGNISCWGDNTYGQLGIGSTSDIGDEAGEMGSNLGLVELPSGRFATQISAGEYMTCAILDNGDVVCWGYGLNGRLGNEDTSTIGDSSGEMGDDLESVDLGTNLVADKIAVGYGTVCAILDDSLVDDNTPEVLKCWGKGAGGVLGKGSQKDLGDNQNEMGNPLLAIELGTDYYPIEIDVGQSFACAILNNNMVKCWGNGADGRLGYEESGNRGDISGEMGDNRPFVELFLPEPTLDQPCDLPAEGASMEVDTLDTISTYVGNKSSTKFTSESCAALAYIDETNNEVRLAVFNKGKWSTETVFGDVTVSNIIDVSLGLDSNDMPHLSVITYLNDGTEYNIHYLTKDQGDWVEKSWTQSSVAITASIIEIMNNDDILIIYQQHYTSESIHYLELVARICSSAQFNATACVDTNDWILMPDGSAYSSEWNIQSASLSNSLDSDISKEGIMFISYLDSGCSGNSDCLTNPGYVNIVQIDSDGFGTPINTTQLAHVSGEYIAGRNAVSGNQTLAIDLGLDGTVHISYLSDVNSLNYTYCSSSCEISSSWSVEDVSNLAGFSGTGVIDMAVGPDLSTLIFAGTSDGVFNLHKSSNSWDLSEVSSSGGSDWISVEISEQGKMWGFVYYPGSSSSIVTFIQEGLTSPGLLSDIDGDGWTRLDEIRCETDFTDSTSSPTDSDDDGECDLNDRSDGQGLFSNSDALAVGDGFACSIGAFRDNPSEIPVTNYSIICWGDNSEGQLGTSGSAITDGKAIFVDLPVGFNAVEIDAGEAHVCAKSSNQELVCWGRNTEGQLGRGVKTATELPGYVIFPDGELIEDFDSGSNHNCAKTVSLKLYCWGETSDNRLGLPLNQLEIEDFSDNSNNWVTDSSYYVHGPNSGYSELYWYRWSSFIETSYYSENFALSAGDSISFKLKAAYFGDNGFDQEWLKISYGDVEVGEILSSDLTRYSSWSDWIEYTVQIPDNYDGDSPARLEFEVRGQYFYLMIDDIVVMPSVIEIPDIDTPSEIYWDQQKYISELSMGDRHSCSLQTNGDVYCWGYNGGSNNLILGNSIHTSENYSDPVKVDLSTENSLVSTKWQNYEVTGISTGGDISCAILESTDSVCWGNSEASYIKDAAFSTISSTGNDGEKSELLLSNNGEIILAYSNDSGISYSINNGINWTNFDVCISSNECNADYGLGATEDSSGNLHFATYDIENGNLMHTYENEAGSWISENLSSFSNSDDSIRGMGPQISKIDELLQVIYLNDSTEDRLESVTVTDVGKYIDVIDEDDYGSTSAVSDDNGLIHMVYETDGALYYVKNSGTSIITETIFNVDYGSPSNPSITVDSNNLPHISYFASWCDCIQYVHHNGTGWEYDNVFLGWDFSVHSTSIELDSGNNPMIVFSGQNTSVSRGTENIMYFSIYNGTNWTINELIVYSSSYYIGSSLDFELNNTGVPYIAYFDDYYSDSLKIMSLVNDSWTTPTVVSNYAGYINIDMNSISMKFDSADNTHISYYDRNYADLKYAYRGFGESSFTNIGLEYTGTVGQMNSLVLDSNDIPHIAYYNAYYADLKYAYCNSSISDCLTSSSNWIYETLDSYQTTGYYPALSIDNYDNLYVIYNNWSWNRMNLLVYRNSNPINEVVSVIGNSHYDMDAEFTGDSTHISYYNGSEEAGSLAYSSKINNVWNTITVDSTSTKTGLYSSLEVDSSGNIHISYLDSTNGDLKYAFYNGTTWAISTVSNNGGLILNTEIVIDNLNYPRIVDLRNNGEFYTHDWDGISWNSIASGTNNISFTSDLGLIVDRRGITKISVNESTSNDLLFVTPKHSKSLLIGNSNSDKSGTLLGAGESGIKSLSIGKSHGCGVFENLIKCWGEGSGGKLGNGDTQSSANPLQVVTISGHTPTEVVVSPTSEGNLGTSCGLFTNHSDSSNTIYCWGEWDVDSSGISTPQQIFMDDTNNAAFSPVDGSETLAEGTTDIIQIDLGSREGASFGCARSRLGHVKCWGYNDVGQLGIGNTTTMGDNENEMGLNLPFVSLGANRTATDIAVGYHHACAILDTGNVTCWGKNNYGQLGIEITSGIYQSIGDTSTELGENLVRVDLGTGRTAVQIDAGDYHTCALLDNGNVKCWGWNQHGQLGIGNMTTIGESENQMGDNLDSVDLGTGRTAISISAGGHMSCAILDTAVLKCWGYNGFGQLGQGHTESIGTGIDVDSNGVSCIEGYADDDNIRECNARMGNGLEGIDLGKNRTVYSVSVGHSHICAILDNGSVKCWGRGIDGSLGSGNVLNYGDETGEMGDSLPYVDLSNNKVKSISSGTYHTCVILVDDNSTCWGDNQYGQLGINSNEDIGDQANEMGENLINVDLGGKTNQIVSSSDYSCAILDDGFIRCWGRASAGQLGVVGSDNIGDAAGDNSGVSMGAYLMITDLSMIPSDYDNDGWIDLWDLDDDNDLRIDTNDDLPFDERDWIDGDDDGLGTNVDTDDDNSAIQTLEQDTINTWSDSEEEACNTLSWSSLSEPSDFDGDGICDELDDDLDGNGWNNTYQTTCFGGESEYWSHRGVWDNSGTSILTSSSDNLRGYDFFLSDYGIRFFYTYNDDRIYHQLMKHDGTFSSLSSIYDRNDFSYMGMMEKNGLLYLTSENAVFRLVDDDSTMSSEVNILGTGSSATELAINDEESMIVRWKGSIPRIEGAYINGSTFMINAPSGISAGDAYHGQLAFGSGNRLHLMIVNISARDGGSPVGFYHYYADLGDKLNDGSTVTWSSGNLILERNSSTSWSSNTGYSATEFHTAELFASGDGNLYAAMYNDTDLWFSTFNGVSWNTEKLAESTGRNEGVTINTNSSGIPHVAWINHTSEKLMISHKNGGIWTTEEIWESNGWPESNSFWAVNYARLTLQFDRQDHPYVMSMDANDSSSAILHHKGELLDPSYTFNPTDANGDGICDTLQYAVIDYGTVNLVLEKGTTFSITPTITGKELVEVWAPNLPEGITIDNETGILSGIPVNIDLGGTDYTIYANSSEAQYNISMNFKISSPPSTLGGWGVNYYYDRPSSVDGDGYSDYAYDLDGNLYIYGEFYSNHAWDGDGFSLPFLNNYDLYIAKRWSNGTWAWVLPIDGSSDLSSGQIAVDNLGNSYVIGNRDSGTLDLPGTEFDLPNREGHFTISVDTDGQIRWSTDAYLSSGSTAADFAVGHRVSWGSYYQSKMHINRSSGELTYAGALRGASSDILDRTFIFGDKSLIIDASHPTYYRPFVVRMDSGGNFTWINSVNFTTTTASLGLQDFGVDNNGNVGLLMNQNNGGTLSFENLSTSSSKDHYVISTINNSGNWDDSFVIDSETPSGFDYDYDSAMMKVDSEGNFIVTMWIYNANTQQVNISGSLYWINDSYANIPNSDLVRELSVDSCVDTMIVLKINRLNHSVENSRKDCITHGAARYAKYYNQILLDDDDRLWLFIGSRSSSYSYHNRVMRLDSQLNLDFEEYLMHINSITNTFRIDWEDVTFDSNGNVLANFYTDSSSLYWDNMYVNYRTSYYYRSWFFMDNVSHTIDGASFISGEPISFGVTGLSAIVGGNTDVYGTEYLDSWQSSELPDGLDINSQTGEIYGTAIGNMSSTNFTVWMNDSTLGNFEFNVSFSILDGKPTVTYPDDTYVFVRGQEISPIVPSLIEGSIVNWTVVPELPEGMHLGDSNGTIYGIPNVNMTTTQFQLRVSSSGATRNIPFSFTINEPLPIISYGNGSYIIPRDSSVNIKPTLSGGIVASFSIDPTELPMGLEFNSTTGKISGVPLLVGNNSSYSVTAINSGGSVSTNFTIWIIGDGISLSLPTSSIQLVENSSMQPIAGQTSGSTPTSWEIYPNLPLGLSFGSDNGTIWGTPISVQEIENYTIWANASGGQVSSVVITISVLVDSDGDGLPDISDSDDDNDGWNDTSELNCGTNSLNPVAFPIDSDYDGICDSLDENDDSIIVFAYLVDELELTVNETNVTISPITSGGFITTWQVTPDLPDGLMLNTSNGNISGVSTTIFSVENFTIWANNSIHSQSFVIAISSSLLDTDGDGIPDIDDQDDDGDGWLDVVEGSCDTDPLDDAEIPEDMDQDGICDDLDLVDDSPIYLTYLEESLELLVNITDVEEEPIIFGGDVRTWEIYPQLPNSLVFDNSSGNITGIVNSEFNQTNYTIWANNSKFNSSFVIVISGQLLDSDGDGIPDEVDVDDDDDGWLDIVEGSCDTNPLDDAEIPEDMDQDGICDGEDSSNDSPIFLSYSLSEISLTVNLTTLSLSPIQYGGDVINWSIYPNLSGNLSFNNQTGELYGVADSQFLEISYLINATNERYSVNYSINISAYHLDSDEDGVPDYIDEDDDNDGWLDVDEDSCNTNTLDYTLMPEDMDQDGVCDFLDSIDDSPIFLVYSSTSQLLFVNEPINPMVAQVFGGDVRTWEVWPPLPSGLMLKGENSRSDVVDGTIIGAPMTNFSAQKFIIYSNNSKYSSSVEITLQSVVPDPDDSDFNFIYMEEILNLTTNQDEVYLDPQVFGGNVSAWSISPETPDGIDFNETNGLITGIIEVELDGVNFIISASNTMYLHTFNITISASLLDTDGDGIPDVDDEDDDGDGWNDDVEIECETDPLDIYTSPEDYDEDGICDLYDELDDSPILFFYPNDKLVLTVGEEIEYLEPVIAPISGDIINFTVIPDLPKGLILNPSNGQISGVPEEPYDHLILEYSHRFTASNGLENSSFSYTVDFDILPPYVENPDTDEDGWGDRDELECNTNPEDNLSVPEDIDLDLICSYIDEDDDGDKIGDLIDKFPKNPTAWFDTDNDSMPDSLTCKYLTNSSNCVFSLIEDLDDDNDGWNDTNETDCGTNPLDVNDFPEDDDNDGVCNLLEEYVPPIVRILWICCMPLLLLLLLLLWLINPFAVKDEEIRGPEPEYTTTQRGWVGGTGEFDDPYVLKGIKNVKKNGFAESFELIKITNISPRLMCDFTDMSADENGSRFSMKPIKSSNRGEISFKMMFNDYGGTMETTTYQGLIRVGKASVYFKWGVEVVVTRDISNEIEKSKVDAEVARLKAEAEEAKAEAESEAAKLKEEAEEAKAEADRIAQERQVRLEREMEERRKRLDELSEKERKREEELLRVAEKSKTIDFSILGVAKTTEIKSEIDENTESLELDDTSNFSDSGEGYISDYRGGTKISWTGKEGNLLLGIKGISRIFSGAMITVSDDLKKIKGVGPFIEDKLNTLGIFTFDQVARMTPELEDKVNEAIEFFPGRIRRDEWAKQASEFVKNR